MSITPFFKNFFDFPSWEEQERRWNDQEQALQNIFSPSLRKNDWFSPSCDVRETEKEILVHAELPGMAKEDIKLDLKDGVLEISGKKEDRVENKDAKTHRLEIRRGEFCRKIALPKGVGAKDISANHKDGLLEIVVKKPEVPPSQTHSISID